MDREGLSKLVRSSDAGRAAKGCGCSCQDVVSSERRMLLGGIVAAGVFAVCGSGTKAIADEGSKPSLQKGDRFALDDEAKKQLKPDDLKSGAALMGVYPVDPATGALRKETRFNMLNLVRLDGIAAGASSSGVIAFSAICTHKGCSITSYEATQKRWRCFCHLSEFDAAGSGEVLDGPAEVSLPTVVLALDAEGYLVADGTFSAEPGAAA